MSGEFLRYVVPGRPVTWQRTNDVRGRRVTDAEQRAAKMAHAWAAAAALGPLRTSWSLDGAFAIGVFGYWPDARVGDLDRLVNLAMDGLEGVAYHKDRQVRRFLESAVLIDEERPRVEVTVRRLAVDPVQRKRERAAVRVRRGKGAA